MTATAIAKSTTKTGVITPQADTDTIDDLDAFCKSSALAIQAAHDSGSDMRKALIMAKSVIGIKQRLTDKVMADVMALQGTPIGFKTDKDRSGGYPVEVVRDVLTQVLISQLRVCGNEFNIIGGNMYATKEGLKRLVSQFAGLTDLEVQLGVPVKQSEAVALVPCTAKWRVNGDIKTIDCVKTEEFDGRIPVKFDQYSSVDAILGKAASKLYRRIYERLTGSTIGAVDDVEVVQEPTMPINPPAKITLESAEVIEPKAKATPEQLPGDFAGALQIAIDAAVTAQQLENAESHWDQKAINRGFTAGQRQTIADIFSAARLING